MNARLQDDRLVVECFDESETDRLGRATAGQLRPGVVVGLIGELGAGKTRLGRAISEALGADPDAISSPTFVLINEYDAVFPIRHIDTYRLRSPEEFDALGVSDHMIEGDGVCLIEWADRVLDRLPKDSWLIRVESTGDSSRRFEISAPGEIIESLREILND